MTDMTNHKDLIGAKKIDLSLFPDVAILHGAHAMFDGAGKYGPYNWRTKHVRATVYITAARRHLLAWAAGEEYAADSGVHHLGHVMGCMAILLDAQATGALLDDRYANAAVVKLLADLNCAVAERTKSRAEVEALAERVVETASDIEDVESLIDIAYREVPSPEDFKRIAERRIAQQPEADTDTEATEYVDWASFPRHPAASTKRVPSEWNGLREGDVCFDHLADRMCRVDEFTQDGDALVVYRLRSGLSVAGQTKASALELVCQMEVSTAGEDREQESGK